MNWYYGMRISWGLSHKNDLNICFYQKVFGNAKCNQDNFEICFIFDGEPPNWINWNCGTGRNVLCCAQWPTGRLVAIHWHFATITITVIYQNYKINKINHLVAHLITWHNFSPLPRTKLSQWRNPFYTQTSAFNLHGYVIFIATKNHSDWRLRPKPLKPNQFF